ncbi:hypothetical protein DdX_15513 [Ditylenchus destructor]|uniref:Uncharacterized protein n=1 Tax=Ditylenchus destructor TaxID=166010 RepID=A0AAD4QUN4_9BILA|nr:hypothetical protein DdX_15513 [Ditylenchus destructor]
MDCNIYTYSMNSNVIMLLLTTLMALLSQECNNVNAGVTAFLKDSVYDDAFLGHVTYSTYKGGSTTLSNMRKLLLKEYPGESKNLQSIAYNARNNRRIRVGENTRYPSTWPDIIFVRKGTAKALVKEDVNGEVLGDPQRIFTIAGKSMTVHEMSNHIKIPEGKRFTWKVYRYNYRKTKVQRVGMLSKVVFERTYIFIVGPLIKDQIQGALTRTFEKASSLLVSKKDVLEENDIAKNLIVDENEEKEGQESKEDDENEIEAGGAGDKNDKQTTLDPAK